MSRSLYFVIPASPTSSFFSQIAMFDLAIRSRPWRLFRPQLIAVFGDKPDDGTYEIWRPHLRSVTKIFLTCEVSMETDYMRQIDWRFRVVPPDADLAIFCDADTLVTGDIEEAAWQVVADQGVAGVIAHHHFPGSSMPAREQWRRISEPLIGREMKFPFAYTLVTPDAPADQRMAPFYLNFGAVFMARASLDRLARRYLDLRPKVSALTDGSYMSAQIALALAVEAEQLPTRALPMAYNFPNDPIADKRYPEDLSDIRILHYLRNKIVERERIFSNPSDFASFMALEVEGSNRALQSFVARLTSGNYPFPGIA